MEVHHPHHLHHKKRWPEYALEFVVLFVAVTLGYMAESIREMRIDKHREVAYLKNVHQDLQYDLRNIESVMESNLTRLAAMDSMVASLEAGTLRTADIYYYVRNLALRATFESSHAGFDQIKAAGGLRLVQDERIVSGIHEYERQLLSLLRLEEVREATLAQVRFKMAAVTDVRTIHEMSQNQVSGEALRFSRPARPYPLVKADRETLNELYSLLVIGLNTNRYLNERLLELKKVGEILDAAIMLEFGSQMH